MAWWMWLVIGFILIAAETLHMALFLVFAGFAAVVVGVVSRLGLGGPEWRQWLLFSVISVVSILLFRKPLLKYLRFNESRSVDSMIGETARAMEAMPANARGKAELRGSIWNAVNVGARPLGSGEYCRVAEVDGITIKVRAE